MQDGDRIVSRIFKALGVLVIRRIAVQHFLKNWQRLDANGRYQGLQGLEKRSELIRKQDLCAPGLLHQRLIDDGRIARRRN